ncbi:MAG: hypothetical protein M0T70_00050 [Geobacteraceae bacterium]|nr:hypothetical protein [Geobacteraceae bacterium]
MLEDRLARLLRRFCAAATAHHEALEAMDEGRANSHARVLAGLYEAVLREGAAGRAGLLALLDHDCPVVSGMAAVYALKFEEELCLAALRRVAAEPGLLGFRASVALERWEAGTWEHPGA